VGVHLDVTHTHPCVTRSWRLVPQGDRDSEQAMDIRPVREVTRDGGFAMMVGSPATAHSYLMEFTPPCLGRWVGAGGGWGVRGQAGRRGGGSGDRWVSRTRERGSRTGGWGLGGRGQVGQGASRGRWVKGWTHVHQRRAVPRVKVCSA
jgi:hypothetical protein